MKLNPERINRFYCMCHLNHSPHNQFWFSLYCWVSFSYELCLDGFVTLNGQSMMRQSIQGRFDVDTVKIGYFSATWEKHGSTQTFTIFANFDFSEFEWWHVTYFWTMLACFLMYKINPFTNVLLWLSFRGFLMLG